MVGARNRLCGLPINYAGCSRLHALRTEGRCGLGIVGIPVDGGIHRLGRSTAFTLRLCPCQGFTSVRKPAIRRFRGVIGQTHRVLDRTAILKLPVRAQGPLRVGTLQLSTGSPQSFLRPKSNARAWGGVGVGRLSRSGEATLKTLRSSRFLLPRLDTNSQALDAKQFWDFGFSEPRKG